MTNATANMTNARAIDPRAFKAALRDQWDKSAAGWNAHAPQIRAWLATATEAMLDRAGIGPGVRVLDVAAGSGDQTLDIARRSFARYGRRMGYAPCGTGVKLKMQRSSKLHIMN